MKNIFPIILLLMLSIFSSCIHQKQNIANPEKLEKQNQPKQLIIYYDSETGKDSLLQAIENYSAKIIYDYENFNAIAISIPKNRNLEQAKKYFEKVNGVLLVENNRIVELQKVNSSMP